MLDVLAGLPDATSAMSPADGTSGLPLAPTLEWTAASGAETYFLQVATNPAFPAGSIVFSETQSGTTAQLPALDPGVVYYWRVRADNFCGETAFSDYFSFQTARLDCGHTYNSEDVPVAISPDDIVTVNSTLDIAEDRSIAAVSIDLLITHTYVGDLDARLLGPDGTNILLFDRPGVPASNFGCSGNNIDVVLSDDAPLSAGELESACSNPPPAISGNYQPLEALSAFNGKSTMGEWQLIVGDYFADDGGSITSWSLSFCFSDSIPPGSFVANNVLMVGTGGAGTITDAYLELTLSGDAEQGLFTLLSLPQHGVLTLNGDTLQFGDTFTQADINAGLLVYTHNGDGATEDQFEFDAVDLNNASWSHNAVFHIVIVPNNLAATAEASGDVLCPGSATGEITVTATGLDGQYLYSLNGGPDQDSNVFTDLPAGTYTVVVTGQFGFTTTTNEVVLEDPDPMQVGVDVVDDDVTVNVTGGAGNLQYSLNGVDFQPENTFVDLPNGFYTVTVMDENGCTVTAEFTVAVNTLVINLEVQSEVSCFDGSDGAIVVTVGGGQMPYSYSLNGGPFQPENVFDGLPAGTYSVEVKDDQGFTVVSNEVTLAAPPAIMVDAAVALNVITVTASGGTGNLEYSLNGVDFQPDNVFENLPNDLYTVVVRDEKGCTATATALVDVAPLTVVAIDFTADILCFGDETAAIEVVASGGIPPYEYAIDGGTYQSSNVFTGLGGGPHSVSVRDAAGTEVQSALFFINQPSPLVAIVNLDGNDAQFMATGGTGPYQFSFDGPNPPVNLPNGDYALTVTDANGCTNVAMFTVNIPPLMLSGEITNIDNCAGEAVVELSATGGEPPYEYSLNGGPFQSSPVFTIFTGNNIVRVRDATGTIVQIPVPLQLNPPVELAVSVSNDTITAS
ncbi:MAG: proprotein convertase P-domain-containing protein, partial [Saprospiraceae bacterium]|nr:proprotein convertase P-domain-containing protein [Saprospiraceae bacterium]